MKTVAIVFVAVLFGAQNTHSQSQGKTVPSYRAESSAHVVRGKNAWTYVTENRSFLFPEVLGDDGNYEAVLLLEETYRNERTDGVEGVRGNATIKAWTLRQGRPRELRWTFKEIGNEGIVQDRFYRVTAWGCCDMPVVYSFYNVLTGRKLYVSNSNLLEVWGDGEGPLAFRYVAFGYAGLSELSQPPQLQYRNRQENSAAILYRILTGVLRRSQDVRFLRRRVGEIPRPERLANELQHRVEIR